MPEQFAYGPEAARIFGVTRADEVWRAIRRHGRDYPGHIEIVKVFGANVVHRGDLIAFAQWYRVNIHRDTRPTKIDRRAALKAAITQLNR